MKFRHAIVVGASSGIGAELVRLLAKEGCKVAAIARRQENLDMLAKEHPGLVLPYVHDVREVGQAAQLFQRITGDLGGLDVIIYSAGIMPNVGLEEFDLETDLAMVDTNLSGAIAWLNLAAIRFSGVGAGTIIGIASVAGDRGRRGQPVYNATKGAMAIYLEALRNRLWRKGVTVVTIKPGPVDTALLDGKGFKNPMPVSVAAAKIMKVSGKQGEHYLKFTHRFAFAIIRLIPGFVFRRMKI